MAFIPILSTLAGQQLASVGAPLGYSTQHLPKTPTRSHARSVPCSPLPPHDDELHQFLVALLAKKGVDLLSCETELIALDLTPDILPNVPLARLIEITGAVEGKLLKLQVFAKEWFLRQEAKRCART